MYKPLSDQLFVNLCSPLKVYIPALSTMKAVPLALVLPSSLVGIGPWIVSVGHCARMFFPVGLMRLDGIIALLNSPPVASDPLPVAGHLVVGAVRPRHHGLKRRIGTPPLVVCEKSPLR